MFKMSWSTEYLHAETTPNNANPTAVHFDAPITTRVGSGAAS